MNIGYACITVGVQGVKQRNCVLKNASNELLRKIINSNLDALTKILDYNIDNGIKLFRISSDFIPFGSHAINNIKWWQEYNYKLKKIGEKAVNAGIRLSLHPGQYTVLNSPNEAVVARSVEELRYHTKLLDSMNLGPQHKLILHIGGVYGDKKAAIKRFIAQYRLLDDNIRCRLVIENDDRQYNISDILSISRSENIPVVFDNLHHKNNPDNTHTEMEWICLCKKTWQKQDGTQKIHYSQQDQSKRAGAHSATINIEEFLRFSTQLPHKDIDIMMEVKDKNLSAVKCLNAIATPNIILLEKEWQRYKYLVLEHSLKNYHEINLLLQHKNSYKVVEFYNLIDESLKLALSSGSIINAAQHIWGKVNHLADEKTFLKYKKTIINIKKGNKNTATKRILWQLANMEKQENLINSLYFKDLY